MFMHKEAANAYDMAAKKFLATLPGLIMFIY